LANIEATVDEVDKVPNQPKSRYSMVVLAAKRARQLKDGAPPLVEPTSTNLLTTALQEIAAGKIGVIEAAEEPDDESPRYIPAGFLVSNYDHFALDSDSTADTDSLDDSLSAEDAGDTEDGPEPNGSVEG
jgi:DNA-directed RNA polymerase subunit omega